MAFIKIKIKECPLNSRKEVKNRMKYYFVTATTSYRGYEWGHHALLIAKDLD